ncbi:hypothetical protein PsYK624_041260 [Phanerochaete sordida]|uniref:Uncharacterized protein n=1 Tax=Phanerochaete sordida TaxID=48140 RepID=A0A9P3G4C3_9APHY|nr:hypothetical protein PsYK624_041260 [Phanerochaete sordida]
MYARALLPRLTFQQTPLYPGSRRRVPALRTGFAHLARQRGLRQSARAHLPLRCEASVRRPEWKARRCAAHASPAIPNAHRRPYVYARPPSPEAPPCTDRPLRRRARVAQLGGGGRAAKRADVSAVACAPAVSLARTRPMPRPLSGCSSRPDFSAARRRAALTGRVLASSLAAHCGSKTHAVVSNILYRPASKLAFVLFLPRKHRTRRRRGLCCKATAPRINDILVTYGTLGFCTLPLRNCARHVCFRASHLIYSVTFPKAPEISVRSDAITPPIFISQRVA